MAGWIAGGFRVSLSPRTNVPLSPSFRLRISAHKAERGDPDAIAALGSHRSFDMLAVAVQLACGRPSKSRSPSGLGRGPKLYGRFDSTGLPHTNRQTPAREEARRREHVVRTPVRPRSPWQHPQRVERSSRRVREPASVADRVMACRAQVDMSASHEKFPRGLTGPG